MKKTNYWQVIPKGSPTVDWLQIGVTVVLVNILVLVGAGSLNTQPERSREVNPEASLNIWLMSDTFEVSKPERLREVKPLAP